MRRRGGSCPISTRARTGLAALAVSLVSVLIPATAEAAFPGLNGQITFNRGSIGEIYAMQLNGAGETNLTNHAASDIAPRWSADGSQIVFATTRGGTGDFEIFKMNADGSGQTSVGGTLDLDWDPAWSPNGGQIAFSGNHNDIYVVNADGSGLTNVTSSEIRESAPAWSPDGSKIAFEARDSNDPTPNYEIWVMNPDGSGAVNLTNNTAGGDFAPDWSPDGSKIAFESNRDGDGEVYVMNADGTNQTRLTSSSGFDGQPAWSPAGNKIVFSSDRDGNHELYVMNPNGSGQTRQTNNAVDDDYPDWQPLSGFSRPNFDAPKSSGWLQFSMVPDSRQTISSTQCQSRGGATSMHGAPLALLSCNPPAPTAGALARLGPKAVGQVMWTAVAGNPATVADEADVAVNVSVSDVRNSTLTSDYDPSPSGTDVTLMTRWRITDNFNGLSGSDAATTSDFDYAVPIACAATPDPTLGSDCTLASSVDSQLPGAIKEGKHMLIPMFRARLNDAGADTVAGNADDRRFSMSGFYVP
jgi:Tol biopolymer transport system component